MPRITGILHRMGARRLDQERKWKSVRASESDSCRGDSWMARKAELDGEDVLQPANCCEVMTMRSIYIVLAAALLTSGCHIGANAADFHVARNPEGAMMRLTTTSGTIDGELLQVRDSGIVILQSDGRVAFASWLATSTAVARNVRMPLSYSRGQPPSAAVRATLILVSHFPQGMTADIEKRVLASRGQQDMLVIR